MQHPSNRFINPDPIHYCMEVYIVSSTENPEELVCRTARGDYTETDTKLVPENDQFQTVTGDSTYVKRNTASSVQWADEHITTVLDGVSGDTLDEQKRHLLNRLISAGHFGVFEHPQITIGVKGISRVTLAQITRHRHLSFDVQSMRYVDMGSEGDAVIPPSLTDDDHVSAEEGTVDVANREFWEEKYAEEVTNLFALYESMVEDGVPKEDARYLLPLGTTVNLHISGNARSMLHFVTIRNKADVQDETRELAQQITTLLEKWMPITMELYQESGPHQLSP